MICTGHQVNRMKKDCIGGVRKRTGEKTTMKKQFTRHGVI